MAQSQFDEAKELRENIKLKGKVLGVLSVMSLTMRKMEQYNILLKWIEQQHQEIINNCADIEKEGGQGRSRRVSSGVLQNHPAVESLKLNRTPKVNDWKQK